MVRLVIASLVICVAAAVVGAVATGWFWLTLTALALGLVAGAAGVSLYHPRADDDPAEDEADVIPLSPRREAADGRGLGRAA